MNGLTIAVIAILIALVISGYQKGFIKKIVGLVSWAVTLILVVLLAPYVAEFLRENTGLYETFRAGLMNSDAEMLQMLEVIGMENMAAEFVAEKLLQLAAAVATFIAASLIVNGVAFALDLTAKLPLLKGINQFGGAAVGLAEGLLLVWIAFIAIGIFSTSDVGGSLLHMVMESEILTWLFTNNPLMRLMAG